MPEKSTKLLLEIDASVELLRRNLQAAESRVGQFDRTVGTSLDRTGRKFATFGRGASVLSRDLEAVRQSTLALGAPLRNALNGFAGLAGGAISTRALIGLADSYTRLQNQLRQTGVDGAALQAVQDRLLETSQRYGVEIEGLAALFSKVSQASTELGASQGQVFAVTDAVSAALAVSGTSAQEASGALLQLGQALRGGKVQAEEYNSLLDGLYPLLEAAAKGSDRWGGSVAKLTADVKGGTVTSREFFAAIVAGSDSLQSRASTATLTASQGFTALTNSLTIYFGEANRSLGATEALGVALTKISQNLDILIPALTAIAGILGARFVAGFIASRAAVVSTSSAIFALQAVAAGAATRMEALAFASQAAGSRMLAAFGGPLGVAIIAVGAAIAYLNSESFKLRGVTEQTRAVQVAAATGATALERAINSLATSYGKAREEALSLIRAQRQVAAFNLDRANRQFEAATRAVLQVRQTPDLAGFGGGAARYEALALAEQDQRAAGQAALDALRTLTAADRALRDPPSSTSPSGGTGGGNGTSRARSSTNQGLSAAERQRRFADEVAQLRSEELRAQLDLTTDVSERADLQRQLLAIDRDQRLASINAIEGLTAAQKSALREQIAAIYGRATGEQQGQDLVVQANNSLAARAIALDERRELDRRAADVAQAEFDAQSDILRSQGELADSATERRRIALELIDLDTEYRRNLLERVIASRASTEAEKEDARRTLARLDATATLAKQQASRQNETPAQAFLREIGRSSDAINEDLQQIQVDGLNLLNDGIVDVITGAKSLGDVFDDVASQIISALLRIAIQRAIIEPLANSLFGVGSAGGSGGGSGGLFGSLFGSLTKRATGGPVRAGVPYLTGEAGRELFIPTADGSILSNATLNSRRGGVSDAPTLALTINAPGATAETVAMIRRELQAAAPQIISAARDVTLRTASRPRLPGAR